MKNDSIVGSANSIIERHYGLAEENKKSEPEKEDAKDKKEPTVKMHKSFHKKL